MARSERLFVLLETLRRHRRPVSGRTLAEETGVSLRTLYRDIASLQELGVTVEGEAGVGYVLRPGFLLPPLGFTEEELEALMLGARWVAREGDAGLGEAAVAACRRIAAVLPEAKRAEFEAAGLFVAPRLKPVAGVDLGILRAAIREERRLAISYRDETGTVTTRTVWPFGLTFFHEVRMMLAWCELREDFRHFRTDRILAVEGQGERYPRRRVTLMRAWRTATGIEVLGP